MSCISNSGCASTAVQVHREQPWLRNCSNTNPNCWFLEAHNDSSFLQHLPRRTSLSTCILYVPAHFLLFATMFLFINSWWSAVLLIRPWIKKPTSGKECQSSTMTLYNLGKRKRSIAHRVLILCVLTLHTDGQAKRKRCGKIDMDEFHWHLLITWVYGTLASSFRLSIIIFKDLDTTFRLVMKS